MRESEGFGLSERVDGVERVNKSVKEMTRIGFKEVDHRRKGESLVYLGKNLQLKN